MTLHGIITTNEPKKIKDLLPDLIESPMGYDIKLFTKIGTIGIERKKIPGDLISSVDDGRLGREILAMRDDTDFQVILLHGRIRYDKDGTVHLAKKVKSYWTEVAINNLLRTIEYVECCFLEYAANNYDLIRVLHELQEYLDKGKHMSLKGRPSIQKNWIIPTKEEKVMYFYQGLPGIRVARAREIYNYFPAPLELFCATPVDIAKVPGIGKNTAKGIYNFLRGDSNR